MFQMQNEALYAAIAPGQVGGQVRGQAPHWKQQCLMRLDLEIQLDALLESLRWAVRPQRYRARAEQSVQLQQHLGREAPSAAVTRVPENPGQIAQAHAAEGRDRLSGKAQMLHR